VSSTWNFFLFVNQSQEDQKEGIFVEHLLLVLLYFALSIQKYRQNFFSLIYLRLQIKINMCV
jgi:hypothetical protein